MNTLDNVGRVKIVANRWFSSFFCRFCFYCAATRFVEEGGKVRVERQTYSCITKKCGAHILLRGITSSSRQPSRWCSLVRKSTKNFGKLWPTWLITSVHPHPSVFVVRPPVNQSQSAPPSEHLDQEALIHSHQLLLLLRVPPLLMQVIIIIIWSSSIF